MGSDQGCWEKDHSLVIWQEPLLSVLPQYSTTSITGRGLTRGSYTHGDTEVGCPIHAKRVSGSPKRQGMEVSVHIHTCRQMVPWPGPGALRGYPATLHLHLSSHGQAWSVHVSDCRGEVGEGRGRSG